MELSLAQAADISIVSKHYPPVTASAITHAISIFLPYANNFPSSKARLTPGKGISEPLHLEHFLMIRRSGGDGQDMALLVVLSFSDQYPNRSPSAVLVPPPGEEKIKNPYPAMGKDGCIRLEELSYLRHTERPFPILDILLAITEQFEREFPLVGFKHLPPISKPASPATGNLKPSNGVAAPSNSNTSRQSLLQEAAERVVIDVNEKAGGYLDTRKQAMQYLNSLAESNRELHNAKKILDAHYRELQGYVPSVENVDTLLHQLEGHEDTIEEHGNCLVPADALQARALELMAEIHASDDTMALLEEGLKRELLTCDEYVKRISDVGRGQFVSRFLYAQVSESLQKASSGAAAAPKADAAGSHSTSSEPPEVPQRLDPVNALRVEFPLIDSDIIRDVLSSVNDEVAVARQQLRVMFP